jgi:hypothetical protein
MQLGLISFMQNAANKPYGQSTIVFLGCRPEGSLAAVVVWTQFPWRQLRIGDLQSRETLARRMPDVKSSADLPSNRDPKAQKAWHAIRLIGRTAQ